MRPTSTPDFVRLSLIGESLSFRHALDLLTRMAACDATVLIQGETGTGKELAARAIHYLSHRHTFPFVPVNCGAIPDSLVENELFGHARGAYTGAGNAQQGLVAETEGGTLFLDEVETLSSRAQVALLRFLQDGTYRRLGGRGDLRGNVRVIAASNSNLQDLARHGTFRSDLLYRLMVMSLALPPLRSRDQDSIILAEHFLNRFSRQYGQGERVMSDAFVQYLRQHNWPGNVRELENLIHREYLMTDAGAMQPPLSDPAAAAPTAPAIENAGLLNDGFQLGFRAARAQAIDTFERSFISWALHQSNGNISRAARRVGKERRSLGRLIKKYGISPAQYLCD